MCVKRRRWTSIRSERYLTHEQLFHPNLRPVIVNSVLVTLFRPDYRSWVRGDTRRVNRVRDGTGKETKNPRKYSGACRTSSSRTTRLGVVGDVSRVVEHRLSRKSNRSVGGAFGRDRTPTTGEGLVTPRPEYSAPDVSYDPRTRHE